MGTNENPSAEGIKFRAKDISKQKAPDYFSANTPPEKTNPLKPIKKFFSAILAFFKAIPKFLKAHRRPIIITLALLIVIPIATYVIVKLITPRNIVIGDYVITEEQIEAYTEELTLYKEQNPALIIEDPRQMATDNLIMNATLKHYNQIKCDNIDIDLSTDFSQQEYYRRIPAENDNLKSALFNCLIAIKSYFLVGIVFDNDVVLNDLNPTERAQYYEDSKIRLTNDFLPLFEQGLPKKEIASHADIDLVVDSIEELYNLDQEKMQDINAVWADYGSCRGDGAECFNDIEMEYEVSPGQIYSVAEKLKSLKEVGDYTDVFAGKNGIFTIMRLEGKSNGIYDSWDHVLEDSKATYIKDDIITRIFSFTINVAGRLFPIDDAYAADDGVYDFTHDKKIENHTCAGHLLTTWVRTSTRSGIGLRGWSFTFNQDTHNCVRTVNDMVLAPASGENLIKIIGNCNGPAPNLYGNSEIWPNGAKLKHPEGYEELWAYSIYRFANDKGAMNDEEYNKYGLPDEHVLDADNKTNGNWDKYHSRFGMQIPWLPRWTNGSGDNGIILVYDDIPLDASFSSNVMVLVGTDWDENHKDSSPWDGQTDKLTFNIKYDTKEGKYSSAAGIVSGDGKINMTFWHRIRIESEQKINDEKYFKDSDADKIDVPKTNIPSERVTMSVTGGATHDFNLSTSVDNPISPLDWFYDAWSKDSSTEPQKVGWIDVYNDVGFDGGRSGIISGLPKPEPKQQAVVKVCQQNKYEPKKFSKAHKSGEGGGSSEACVTFIILGDGEGDGPTPPEECPLPDSEYTRDAGRTNAQTGVINHTKGGGWKETDPKNENSQMVYTWAKPGDGIQFKHTLCYGVQAVEGSNAPTAEDGRKTDPPRGVSDTTTKNDTSISGSTTVQFDSVHQASGDGWSNPYRDYIRHYVNNGYTCTNATTPNPVRSYYPSEYGDEPYYDTWSDYYYCPSSIRYPSAGWYYDSAYFASNNRCRRYKNVYTYSCSKVNNNANVGLGGQIPPPTQVTIKASTAPASSGKYLFGNTLTGGTSQSFTIGSLQKRSPAVANADSSGDYYFEYYSPSVANNAAGDKYKCYDAARRLPVFLNNTYQIPGFFDNSQNHISNCGPRTQVPTTSDVGKVIQQDMDYNNTRAWVNTRHNTATGDCGCCGCGGGCALTPHNFDITYEQALAGASIMGYNVAYCYGGPSCGCCGCEYGCCGTSLKDTNYRLFPLTITSVNRTQSAQVRIPYNYKTTLGNISLPNHGGRTIMGGSPINLNPPAITVNPRVNEAVDDSAYATITKTSRTRVLTFVIGNGQTEDPGAILQPNPAVPGGRDYNLCNYYSGYSIHSCTTIYGDNNKTYNRNGILSGTTFNSSTTEYVWDGGPLRINVPDNLTLGEKFCVAVGVWPSDSHNNLSATTSTSAENNIHTGDISLSNNESGRDGNLWNVTKVECRTIAKKPTIQTWNSGVYAGGNITTSRTQKTPDMGRLYPWTGSNDISIVGNYEDRELHLFGSWTEREAIAVGGIKGFSSGAGLGYNETSILKYGGTWGWPINQRNYAQSATTQNRLTIGETGTWFLQNYGYGGYPRDMYLNDCNVTKLTISNSNCSSDTTGYANIKFDTTLLINRLRARYTNQKAASSVYKPCIILDDRAGAMQRNLCRGIASYDSADLANNSDRYRDYLELVNKGYITLTSVTSRTYSPSESGNPTVCGPSPSGWTFDTAYHTSNNRCRSFRYDPDTDTTEYNPSMSGDPATCESSTTTLPDGWYFDDAYLSSNHRCRRYKVVYTHEFSGGYHATVHNTVDVVNVDDAGNKIEDLNTLVSSYIRVDGDAYLPYGSNLLCVAKSGALSRTVIIDVKGKLVIGSDIKLGGMGAGCPDETYSAAGQIPQVLIFANGIQVLDSVTRIDAWLIVNGNIDTCVSPNPNIGTNLLSHLSPITYKNPNNNYNNATGPVLHSGVCNRKLTFNGPIYSKSITFNRNHGAGHNASHVGSGPWAIESGEIFNLRTDAYLWTYAQMQRYTQANVTYTRELAPRY